MEQDRIDEAMELLWGLEEESALKADAFIRSSEDKDPEAVIKALKSKGFISVNGEAIAFTEKGRELARSVVRRHRLAERLFMDVFDLSNEEAEADACRVEHSLSENLTDSVCTFLGHPPLCPHGKPIPRGECCKKFSVDIKPVVMRLTEFEVGAQCKIVFITPSELSRIGRLSSIGIIPGEVVRLIQKRPSVVLQIEETTIAIDTDMAKEIFVKKL